MRKFIFALLAILMLVGTAFAGNVPSGPNEAGDILGQGKYPQDPHRIFRFVRYVQPNSFTANIASRSWATADSLVIWDTRYGEALGKSKDGVTVTLTSTSYDSRVAGVIILSALSQETEGNAVTDDVGKQNWTWLQTYGKSTIRTHTVSSIASGDAIATAGSGGVFGLGAEWGANAGYVSAPYMGIAGFALEDCPGSDTTCEVFLKGLD